MDTTGLKFNMYNSIRIMQTRSQTYRKKVEFSVDIDFDESSRAWRANKKHLGDGHFEYTDNVLDNITKNNRLGVSTNNVWFPVQEDANDYLPPRRRKSPERYSS